LNFYHFIINAIANIISLSRSVKKSSTQESASYEHKLKGSTSMSIICPNCGHDNQSDALYCDECGVELAVADSLEEPSLPVESSEIASLEVSLSESEEISPISESETESAVMAETAESISTEAFSSESTLSTSVNSEQLAREEFSTTIPQPETTMSKPETTESPIPVGAPTRLDFPEEPNPKPVSTPTTLELPQAALVHSETGTRFEIPPGEETVYIGRVNEELPVQIDLSNLPDADVVSRVHAVIHCEEEVYYLEDAGSANGTWLNGEELQPGTRFRRQLKAGDTITLGRHHKINFNFELED
jgi:hypothetical protein